MGVYLFKRANGYWYILIKSADGKHRWITTKTKKKAEAYAKLREYKPNQGEKHAEYTLSEFIEFFKQRVSGSIRPSTLSTYLYGFKLLKDAITDMPISRITVSHLEKFDLPPFHVPT